MAEQPLKPVWLILTYTLIAGVVAAVTAPIPGTSLLLTGLEIYMIVHIAKIHNSSVGFKEVGYSAIAIYSLSTILQDTALELLTFLPVIGWIAEVIVAVLFVLFLGSLANLYFRKPSRNSRDLKKNAD